MRTSGWLLIAGLAALAGCTTGRGNQGVDAHLNFDGRIGSDGSPGIDGRFPTPTVDTCTTESMGSTIGNDCTSGNECDDGCFCTGLESCEAGVCVAGEDPCIDEVECTADVCLEETDQCFRHPRHEMCADADACNGYEVCDVSMGCRAASPLYCNDENACTVDSCDTTEGCIYTLRDLDGDGFIDGRCGGDDCDDDPRYGRTIYPGATEDCTNRRDDNCDGMRDFNDPTCMPTNDACASAAVLPGAGTFSGSTAGLAADYALGCKPTGPDAVFRITLTEMQDMRVSVGGGGSGTAVAIRPWGACASGPDEKCNAATPPSALRRSLPAGEWAIIVKTTSGAPFDLTVDLSAPTPVPPVDVCNMTTVDVSAGGTFTGVFEEVEDDYALSCHSGTGWKDAAYRFTLTAPKDVVLRGSTSATYTPTTYISLLTDCTSAASTVTCRSGTASEIRARALPAGTYYVLIESSNTAATGWSLDVSISDPAPREPGDACSSAVDITSAMGSATLALAELDTGTSCGGTSTAYRDVFFYFDLMTTRDVTLTTTAPTTQYTAVSTTCGATGSEIRCRSSGTSLVQLFRSLPAGRYFVVTSVATSAGSVAATVVTAPPTPIPPNDRCSGAIEVGGGYSRTDTLIGFEDDVVGCTGSGYPDAFYSITLTARMNVSILASRPMGMTGTTYLTLRDSCTATVNRACNSTSPTAVIDTTLDPGTYILIVEQIASTAGDFNLRVFVTPP